MRVIYSGAKSIKIFSTRCTPAGVPASLVGTYIKVRNPSLFMGWLKEGADVYRVEICFPLIVSTVNVPGHVFTIAAATGRVFAV
jgi:hypothetical protein